jgi:hypothetical protein
MQVSNAGDIEAGIDGLAQQPNAGLVVLPDVGVVVQRDLILARIGLVVLPDVGVVVQRDLILARIAHHQIVLTADFGSERVAWSPTG